MGNDVGRMVLIRMVKEKEFIKRIKDKMSKFDILLRKYMCIYLKDKKHLNSSLNPEDFLYESEVIISNKYILVGSDRLGKIHRKLYSPKPDLALAPFNLQEKTSRKILDLCRYIKEHCPSIKLFVNELKKCYYDNVKKYEKEIRPYMIGNHSAKVMGEILEVNKNPRSFIAVEVCFSGSMKHTLGSLVNASILGYYGILVTNTKMLLKALRLKYYLISITRLKKIDSVIGMNLFIITSKQLEKLLENLN